MSRVDKPKRTVLFAGNPNVGKSTLFNGLTGSRQHTGNWSGKTVAAASGRLRKHKDWELVDLPGIHSLHGSSEDERVAAQWICSKAGDCVVVVCDGAGKSSVKNDIVNAVCAVTGVYEHNVAVFERK